MEEEEKETSTDNSSAAIHVVSDSKEEESVLHVGQKDAEVSIEKQHEKLEEDCDMESWMEEHGAKDSKEKDSSVPVELKQESDVDEDFHEAPESLNSLVLEQVASTATPEIVSSNSTAEQEKMDDVGDHVVETQVFEQAENLEDSSSPASASVSKHDDLQEDEVHEGVCLSKPKDDGVVEQEVEKVAEDDTATAPEIEEGPKSLGGESLEEFEVLSPLSRETSIEETSTGSTLAATGKCKIWRYLLRTATNAPVVNPNVKRNPNPNPNLNPYPTPN